MLALLLASAVLVDALPATPASFDRPQPVAEHFQTTDAAPLSSVAVTLECTAFADGHVGGCRVMQETHPGLGFDRAAIALMQDEQIAPGTRDIQFARTFQFLP